MTKELAFPNNRSLQFFLGNWRKVVFGGLAYLFWHPFTGMRVIKPRLDFAVRKRSLELPIKTPEGFTLETNAEMLVYTQIFVEQNLKHRPFVREFRYYPNPVVIDIGYNCGFVTKWLNGINSTANFYGLEVHRQQIDRAKEMDQALEFRPHAKVFERAAWSQSGLKLSINVGENITTQKTHRTTDSFEIETLAVDDIEDTKSEPIFLLKIDTDGSNVEILNGSVNTLRKTKWLLIENEPGVMDWIAANLPGWKMRKLTHCDFILRNPER